MSATILANRPIKPDRHPPLTRTGGPETLSSHVQLGGDRPQVAGCSPGEAGEGMVIPFPELQESHKDVPLDRILQ